VQLKRISGSRCCRSERLDWRHARFDQQLQLRVQARAVRGSGKWGVGAGEYGHTDFDQLAKLFFREAETGAGGVRLRSRYKTARGSAVDIRGNPSIL